MDKYRSPVNIKSCSKIAEYSKRLAEDAELNMKFMALLSNRPEVRKAHDEINWGMVNKNVAIDVLLYMLIKYNLGDKDG